MDDDVLIESFEGHRARLRAVAYRMLGSPAEADDAVQEAWLRLSRSDRSDVDNLGGWLTTVIARVCLDMLRSRTSRREDSFEDHDPEAVHALDESGIGPERELLLAEAIGPALLVVLETLTPAERIAFVLHDMFAVPFDEIAPILGRSSAATRQLASRARRRVQGADVPRADLTRQREVVEAFLAASRGGDLDALLAVLDPDVVVRADAAAVASGAEPEVHGAVAVAETFAGRARAARPALVDGRFGLVWARGGRPQVVFDLRISGGRITSVDLVADPAALSGFDLVLLD